MSTLNRELPYINAFGTVDISAATNVESALTLLVLIGKLRLRHFMMSSATNTPSIVQMSEVTTTHSLVSLLMHTR